MERRIIHYLSMHWPFLCFVSFNKLIIRDLLPDPVKSVLQEGRELYYLHIAELGREKDPGKGPYAKLWDKWEKKLLEVLISNKEYLKSVQVPFDSAVQYVLEELRKIAKGENAMPST